MDPLNELSTLVASYVITWRDLCSADTLPTRESITFQAIYEGAPGDIAVFVRMREIAARAPEERWKFVGARSEEHTSELQSQSNLVCRLLLEKKKKEKKIT